jgi:transcriptional regulator with XRE-family HTH domain
MRDLTENEEVFIDEAINLIKLTMRSQGMNQSQLAAKLGVNHSSTISMALNGNKHSLSLRRLTELFNAMGYQPHISIERIR